MTESLKMSWNCPYILFFLCQINVEQKYRVIFNLHGRGVDEEPIGVLSIDDTDGSVWVYKKVDYEAYQMLKVLIYHLHGHN